MNGMVTLYPFLVWGLVRELHHTIDTGAISLPKIATAEREVEQACWRSGVPSLVRRTTELPRASVPSHDLVSLCRTPRTCPVEMRGVILSMFPIIQERIKNGPGP